MKKIIILPFLLIFINGLQGQSIQGNQRKWQPLTMDFEGPGAYELDESPNPFLDYRMQVRFTSPSGDIYSVPGFFAGDGEGGPRGKIWRVRFLPDEIGGWDYEVSFGVGDALAVSLNDEEGEPVASLDGETGEFYIRKKAEGSRGFYKKGRLEYTGGYYLQFQDGDYWLKGGADSPESLFGFEDFDNTPYATHHLETHARDWLTGDPTWESEEGEEGLGKPMIGALNYLASKHVNSIYFITMNIGGDGKDTWPYVGYINPEGDPGNDNLHFDISKLRQWNIVMNYAQQKGIHLHCVLGEGEAANKRELDDTALGVERKLYYREMIARFGYLPALQWNISEEYDIDLDIGEELAKEWGQYIRDVDPYDHPTVVHNTGTVDEKYKPFLAEDSPFNSTSWQDRGPDQGTGSPTGEVIEMIRNWGNEAGYKKLPVYMDEHDDIRPLMEYNNDNRTMTMPEARREWIWPAYLSGSAGVEMYMGGGDDSFDTDLQNFREFEVLWEWQTIARFFMEAYLPYWEMEPADELLSGEAEQDSFEGQVFAKEGEVYALYFPDASATGTLDLSNVEGSFVVRWFNPRSGHFVGDTRKIRGGRDFEPGAPPEGEEMDWVMLIERI